MDATVQANSEALGSLNMLNKLIQLTFEELEEGLEDDDGK